MLLNRRALELKYSYDLGGDYMEILSNDLRRIKVNSNMCGIFFFYGAFKSMLIPDDYLDLPTQIFWQDF